MKKNRLRKFSDSKVNITENLNNADTKTFFDDLGIVVEIDKQKVGVNYTHTGFNISYTGQSIGGDFSVDINDGRNIAKAKFLGMEVRFPQSNIKQNQLSDAKAFTNLLGEFFRNLQNNNFVKSCHDHWYNHYGKDWLHDMEYS